MANTRPDSSQIQFSPTETVKQALQRLSDFSVDPAMFGAVGDGVTDDTAAVLAAHTYANTNDLPVSYAGLKTVALQANAQIPMKTSTDFGGCMLVILGGVVPSPSFSSFNVLYNVTDDACPEVTVVGAVTSTNLTKGALFPTLGLFDGHGFALLSCGLQVPARDKIATMNYTQAFKVNRFGRASHPLSTDLSAFAAAITVTYRKTSVKRLRISNVNCTEGAWNNQRIFDIRRCNVHVDGFTMMFTGGTFNNVCEIIRLTNCSDVSIDNFITTGRPVTTTTGSYCLAMYGAADIFVNNMNALTGWGATGTDDVSGLHFTKCVLNRIDAHSSGHNVFADDCDLHEAGMVYGWGGGILSVKNSRVYRSSVIAARDDYGGSFFGAMIVDNVEVNNNFTSTYYAINLLSNALGASIPVYAPEIISVSSIRRTGRASGANAEFVPVAVAVRGVTDVVYAPNTINVDNVSCYAGWRFGLRVDTLNMEANPASPITIISVNNAQADTTPTTTNGILDLTSIRTPTVPVRPRISVSNSSNVHIQNFAAGNLDIFCYNSNINGISTLLTAQSNLVTQLVSCRLVTMATGYTNAPIGGITNGTNSFTSLSNCDISALTWDLSNVASFIGNTIRKGSGTPLLPAGVTTTQAFTGYQKTGFFQ